MRLRRLPVLGFALLSLGALGGLLNVAHAPVLAAPPFLEALLVGSTSRQQLLDVASLFLARTLPLHVFTEDNTAACVLCADRARWADPARYDSFGLDLNVSIWAERPAGWWCAQARPSAALSAFLRRTPRRALPRHLLVLDDDTWVNVRRLRALLVQLGRERASDADAPLYLGFTGHQFRDLPEPPPFCYGGGGYVLNRAALLALLAPSAPRSRVSWLDACNARKAGGRWCHYHSDWVVGQCLLRAAGAACDWRAAAELFVQAVPSGGAAACMAEKVACHGGLGVAELVQGYTGLLP